MGEEDGEEPPANNKELKRLPWSKFMSASVPQAPGVPNDDDVSKLVRSVNASRHQVDPNRQLKIDVAGKVKDEGKKTAKGKVKDKAKGQRQGQS